MDHKESILKALKANPDRFISGEELSDQLHISRTMIWKYIRSLRDEGYVIESTPNRGYKFIKATDLLIPEEIKNNLQTECIGRQIYYFDEIDSTNQKAKELAPECIEGTVIIAERQSKGKGRMGREWYSPPGGIWLTVILKPDMPPDHIYRLTLMAGVSVTEALKDIGIKVHLKWPNDITVNEKKVCGILTEVDAEMDAVNFVVVGIGIDANNEMDALPPIMRINTTSLMEQTGKKIDRILLVKRVLERLEKDYNTFLSGDFSSILNRWKQYSSTLNRRVKIVTRFNIIEGEAVGIDHDGALVIELDDGTLEREISGTCIHL
jgi:BirA family biotin operon repressor/biotin-[acetyl-CoA-carboxylase] ligase